LSQSPDIISRIVLHDKETWPHEWLKLCKHTAIPNLYTNKELTQRSLDGLLDETELVAIDAEAEYGPERIAQQAAGGWCKVRSPTGRRRLLLTFAANEGEFTTPTRWMEP
jgi:hypothetical protein